MSVERLSYKSKNLSYREGDHLLVLYVEMTGFFAPYDYVGGTECFSTWTTPEGQSIEVSHSHAIRSRIEEWTRKHGFTVGFGRTISREEMFADMVAKGWKREDRPDGSVAFSPPPPKGLLQRLIRWNWR